MIMKSHFKFTQGQRNGIFLLLALIVVSQCIYFFVDFSSDEVPVDSEKLQVFQNEIDSLRRVEIENNKPKTYPFNPNYITDYKGYTFGLKHKGYNNVVNGTDHKYGFGGKEEQDELDLDWHDFGARNYDAALGRWMNIDPYAGKYMSFSPYNYALNNPLTFVDPNGKELFIAGNRKEKRQIFRELKKLSNNRLKLNRKTGEVSIGKGKRNKGKSLKTGTGVLANVIGDDNRATIQTVGSFNKEHKGEVNAIGQAIDNQSGNQTISLGDFEKQFDGEGANAKILFDPSDNGSNIKNADGSTGRPTLIGLAHELIHGESILGGNVIDASPNDNVVNPDNGRAGDISPEEVNIRLIENDIREEQGIILRATPSDNTLKNLDKYIKNNGKKKKKK